MEKETISNLAAELWKSVPGNVLCKSMDILQEYVGISMFDMPLIGFGSAEDELFQIYKKPEAVGPWHRSPKEWIPDAQTVISFFFPASMEVRKSNREQKQYGSVLWSYARIEGQEFIHAFMEAVAEWFRKNGYTACVPSFDERWQRVAGGKGITGYPEINENTYSSSWSERHAAYVCGLGTFCLSKGLITRKGVAGRFGSVVVSAYFEPDSKPYAGIYDYCSKCGACIKRCPAQAIDLRNGKDHKKCERCVSATRIILSPRFGCGLCQTAVPCEEKVPAS